MICVGIAGGTCSGKSHLAEQLQIRLGEQATTVAQDWYYNDNAALTMDQRRCINYDHPDAIEWPLLLEHLRMLKKGHSVEAPQYDFPNHTRAAHTHLVMAAPVLILEGILILQQPEIRTLLDFGIFIEVDREVRLQRRIDRDLVERGRELEQILHSYDTFAQPMYQKFVEPAVHHADIIWRQLQEPEALAAILAKIRGLLEAAQPAASPV